MQSVSSNAVYKAIDAENTQVLNWLNGYGNNISYISQQALAEFNSYFANVANYTSFDYSTSSGVEYRIIGFKHTNYGTGIVYKGLYFRYLYFK